MRSVMRGRHSFQHFGTRPTKRTILTCLLLLIVVFDMYNIYYTNSDHINNHAVIDDNVRILKTSEDSNRRQGKTEI